MITTDRLKITFATLEDIDDLYEYASMDSITFYERKMFKTKPELLKLLTQIVEHEILYVVRLKESPKVIGHIFAGKTAPAENDEYNIGYMFHPNYHGFGYCTEACKAVIDYVFTNKDANRVRAACHPENIASWKVMEKLGLEKEGFFKNRYYWKEDEQGNKLYTDQFMYGITKEDYIKRKEYE